MKFIDIPTEQSTAITDLLLAMLVLGCVADLIRHRKDDPWKAAIWSWTFGLLAIASLLGVFAHGLQLSTTVLQLLWQPLNLVLGLTIALFVEGAVYDRYGRSVARRALLPLLGTGLFFFGVTQVLTGTFLVFIVYEALAMLAALTIYTQLTFQGRTRGAAWMAAGVLVTLIAAAVQAMGTVRITLGWPLDHNGVFHLIQMVGVGLLWAGLRAGLRPGSGMGERSASVPQ